MTDTLYWVLIALAVLIFVLIVVFGMILWDMIYGNEGKRLEQRLQAVGSPLRRQEAQFQGDRRFSQNDWLHAKLENRTWAQRIDQVLMASGHDKILVDRFLQISFLTGGLLFLMTVLFGLDFWVGLLFFVLGFVLPLMFFRNRVQARAAKFEKQLPDVLDFIARAMQAGHAFGPAIQMAAAESPQPISAEFGRAQQEMNFGSPTGKVLSDLAERLDSADMRFFAVAVSINREVGGDLSHLLENVASLVRERVDMRASVMAMTAEGRFSALLLGALPFLVAGLLTLMNPDMVSTLWTDPMGRNMLFGALGLMAVGGLWMRSMIKIKI